MLDSVSHVEGVRYRPLITPVMRSPLLTGGPPVVTVTKKADDEGKAHISAEHASQEKDARISRADEHKERAPGSEAATRQGTQAADGQRVTSDRRRAATGKARFRPNEHIRRRVEFQEVYARGGRVQGRFTTLFILPNTLNVGRLGIAATKKLGGAVQRNRAKRLIREVFRRYKVAPGFDVVVVPRRELLDASLSTLETDYRTLLERRLRPSR